MDGIIAADLHGRLRVRIRPELLNIADFKRLSEALQFFSADISCFYTGLTGSLLILYENGPILRDHIIETLASFEPRSELGLGDTEENAEEVMPPNPIWGHLAKKLLPFPISCAVNILKAIPYFFSGLFDLLRGRLSVEVLDAAALTVCFLRRDYRSVGTLLFFFALGHFLEMWTKRLSRAGLYHSLIDQVEKIWIRDADGRDRLIDEKQLTVDTLIVLRAGTMIPADGLVVEGEGLVNQSTMTGEPLPVRRAPGSTVFAGTSVEEGEIIVKATKVGDGTKVKSIIRYIEESEASKAGIQSRAERLADSIVPFSFILSALVYLITKNPLKAGNVLLVDYSCAIRLSTPLAILAAMREGSEQGLLIKGGRYLEEIAQADTTVFDKTGTLTMAKPQVARVIPFAPFNRCEALRLAACLEEHFPHPVGRAVVRQAQLENLNHEEEHAQVDYLVAHGISTTWRNQKVVLGSRHFVVEDEMVKLDAGQEIEAEAEASKGHSIVYMAVDGRLAALISVEDQPRPEVPSILADLRSEGISRALMLTGDIESTARAMAEQAGFQEFKANLLPDDKAAFIDALKAEGRHVIMVGDGLNDSAALSRADVGVAMSDGSDLAKDVANVLLLNGRLDRLVAARRLSTATMRRIKSNYWVIVGANSLFLALGLFGLAGSSLTALLHNATTAAVAYRSLRPLLPPVDKE